MGISAGKTTQSYLRGKAPWADQKANQDTYLRGLWTCTFHRENATERNFEPGQAPHGGRGRLVQETPYLVLCKRRAETTGLV